MTDKPEIKVGQRWVTRDGRISRIVVTDAEGDYPIMGFLPDTREADFYTLEGVSESHDPVAGHGAGFDLISLAPTTVKRTVALYRSEGGQIHTLDRDDVIDGQDMRRISEPLEIELTLLPGEEP